MGFLKNVHGKNRNVKNGSRSRMARVHCLVCVCVFGCRTVQTVPVPCVVSQIISGVVFSMANQSIFLCNWLQANKCILLMFLQTESSNNTTPTSRIHSIRSLFVLRSTDLLARSLPFAVCLCMCVAFIFFCLFLF